MKRYALVALAVLSACDKRDKLPMDREAAKKLFDMHRLQAAPGMSDLTIDDRGVLWSISERHREILEIDVRTQPIVPIVHKLEGIAAGVDTESIAWLGNGKFMIGVEGANGPWAALVSAELRGDVIAATATRELVDSQIGVTLKANHGVEALCGRDGELLAGIESVGKDPISGKRFAPLVRLRGDSIHAAKLWLTSEKGKLSAMACTIADDGTAQVIAIERHFGVARILKFSIGRTDVEVTPTVDLDLHSIIHDDFNLEGIARLLDGRLVMINDNQGRMASGSTELFLFHPR